MDPIYGFGNCEDSDYNIRTYRIGYSAQICVDILIDHVGSATFNSSKLPYSQLLRQNILYSHFKHFPEEEARNIIENHTDSEKMLASRNLWLKSRGFDHDWDVIPYKIVDCLRTTLPESSLYFPKEKTLIAYPSVQHRNWLPTVQTALEKGWNIILRIEPPIHFYADDIKTQIEILAQDLQAKIQIDFQSCPTKHRGNIYSQGSGLLYLERFDWFRFEREVKAISFPIIHI
jgi:hypothetical protein